jgi:hypothetical protein
MRFLRGKSFLGHTMDVYIPQYMQGWDAIGMYDVMENIVQFLSSLCTVMHGDNTVQALGRMIVQH